MNKNQADSAVREMVERFSNDLRVCMMAEVIACDPAGIVSVLPLHNERKIAELDRVVEFEEMQPIEEVPLAQGWGIKFLPEIGDHGLLIFHDVDLEGYKLTRERLDLKSPRNHDYNDAIFLPCETAFVDRPDPYATFENNMITFHKKVLFELEAKNEVDFIAGAQSASLVNTNMAYNTHTHTGNLGFSTGSAQAPAQPGIFIPEVPKVG